jgi:antitoxin FitA
MHSILVRNLPDATHRALKIRASRHGRSTEAEVREILEDAVHPKGRIRVGSELLKVGTRFGGVTLKISRKGGAPKSARFD